jgi:plastocyanin
MRRRLLPLAAALAVVLVAAVLTVPAALAGGYCHTPATDERGTTVEMKEHCYSPTVLRVPAGGQVTFVNRDAVAHPTVGRGSGWGFDGNASGRATVRFDEPGIFPYFCHEHIGMVGVIVVGDGKSATAAAAPARVADPPAGQPAAEPAAARGMSWSLPAAALVALGLAGGTLALLLARRRRAAAASQG